MLKTSKFKMRRIDRILFSALRREVYEKPELSDDGNIPKAPLVFEADAPMNINCEDNGFPDTSNLLCSPAPLAVITHNAIMGSGSKPDMESPAAPVYSLLTPLVTARKA
ncbi:unnamed protein product [Parnassius mnemosyne]|uniref:Uncharacterized protein n=1 Tax=Parnassius mnemosyne TaxID=213953 RepID=A0AAV1LY00_9NEOP